MFSLVFEVKFSGSEKFVQFLPTLKKLIKILKEIFKKMMITKQEALCMQTMCKKFRFLS